MPTSLSHVGVVLEIQSAGRVTKGAEKRARRRCARLLALGDGPAVGPRVRWPGRQPTFIPGAWVSGRPLPRCDLRSWLPSSRGGGGPEGRSLVGWRHVSPRWSFCDQPTPAGDSWEEREDETRAKFLRQFSRRVGDVRKGLSK